MTSAQRRELQKLLKAFKKNIASLNITLSSGKIIDDAVEVELKGMYELSSEFIGFVERNYIVEETLEGATSELEKELLAFVKSILIISPMGETTDVWHTFNEFIDVNIYKDSEGIIHATAYPVENHQTNTAHGTKIL